MSAADRPHRHSSAPPRADADEDARLVAAIRAGDASAFEALFTRHRDGLYRLAWRFTRDAHAAQDLVQETFVRVYESLGSFRGEGSLGTWLRRIISNLAIDRSRRKSTKTVAFEEELFSTAHASGGGHRPLPAEPSPARSAELHEFSEAVQGAVAKLSEAHREVFLLHAVEELSYKQIAACVGCNLGTVMSRLHYARKNLQELLQAHWEPIDE